MNTQTLAKALTSMEVRMTGRLRSLEEAVRGGSDVTVATAVTTATSTTTTTTL